MSVNAWFWDFIAGSYDTETAKFRGNLDLCMERAKKHLRSSDAVLDFACGTGTATVGIAGGVRIVEGIDISSKMIEAARRKAEERGIRNIVFRRAAIFDKRLAPESFDAVLAFNVLHLLADPGSIIRRIHRLLKPDGWFLSMTPCLGEGGRTLPAVIDVPLLLLNRLGLFSALRFYRSGQAEQMITAGGFGIRESELMTDGHAVYFAAAQKA
jgi:2-polyprenyl-3-methyl-5-hydroxy-6-metoxy-1,4-benzoquinol methylase